MFQSDYLVANGKPAVDSTGVLIPVFTPAVSRVQNWLFTGVLRRATGSSLEVERCAKNDRVADLTIGRARLRS